MVSKEKGACERLKRLQPAENKLFGGKVPGLTKALRDGDQVIIYLLFFAKLLNKLVFPQLRTFGMKGSPVEVKKESIGSNVTYQPGAFKGKSRFFQSSRGGKSVNKRCGHSFIKGEYAFNRNYVA